MEGTVTSFLSMADALMNFSTGLPTLLTAVAHMFPEETISHLIS